MLYASISTVLSLQATCTSTFGRYVSMQSLLRLSWQNEHQFVGDVGCPVFVRWERNHSQGIYRIGHLWSTGKWSLLNTGGGEGVEVVVNEPYEEDGESGHFTHKIFHLASKVPKVIRMLAPKGSLEIHEKSWNRFTEVKTVTSNPDYMKDGYHTTTHTRLVKAADCDQDNIFSDISSDIDDVIHLDIVNDPIASSDYKVDEDPTKCDSGFGNLSPDWQKSEVRMCVHKLVEVEFHWFGLQGTVESRIQKVCPRFFRNLHRQMFCWTDNWIRLSIDDIRVWEDEVKDELDKTRTIGEVRGMSEQ
ncbi:phosphatidylinositol transfer protein alpha isoform-like isoform X2 [Patiria miniata]|uniref:Phosphatidylinositol transfer protein N-terminal domain-containing protein n=1 Tax=Patiria miniata TaxID=46514 RepID=A0A914AYX3_PATMI|nr:phosphatidylinositol transfer protein alpha isoform-like isoform X2 [Patiria miniata]